MTQCGKFVKSYMAPDRDGLGGEHEVELNTAYACSVEPPGHEGPCAAIEQPVTVAARTRWLEANRRKQADIQHAKSGLGQFHGRPVTFHEHMGADEPTIHPDMTVPCPLCDDKGIRAKDLDNHIRQDHRTDPSQVRTAQRELGVEGEDYIIDSPKPNPEKDRPSREAILAALEEGRDRMPERANRPGDQPLPTTNDQAYIQDLAIADIEERRQVGIRRYGTALQPFNNRDAFRDAYEEVLDLLLYLRQVRVERDEMYIHAAALWQWWGATRALQTKPETFFPDEIAEHLETLVEWLQPSKSQ